MRRLLIAAAVGCLSTSAAWAERAADPLMARIETADATAFFEIYDAAGGTPDAAALKPYVERTSPGVRGFIEGRIKSAERLAEVIAKKPKIYADAKACAGRLGHVRERVRAAFLAMEQLYPEATFPETYILIGADNSGGTANKEALMIGLEVVCRADAPDDAPLDVSLTHLIAHEMVHSLQSGYQGETVLSQSLDEGAAEFLTELITGRIS